ncbi:MAG: hypothetical protein II152_05995 [Succinivibrionaceae bacterium]|nr:hypothetical protein [Succinivibrionaceae bacterium]
MMEKLNRIEENQRSFFDKLMQRVGNGLEMLGSGLEKLGNMLDRTGDNLLITSGRIQAGFDRLTGQENFAEYPSRPQAPQQGAGNGDDALHKKIAELEAEIKKLREENTRLKEQLEQQKQQSKNPETRNEDKAPELADPAETAAMEKTSGKQEQKRAEAKTETRNEDKAPEPASDEEKLQNKAPELADPAETAAVEKTPGKQEQKRAEAKTDRTDKTVETKHPGQGMRGQGSGTAAPAEQPEQASQNTNELARELANRVKPLADVSLVEDADLQRVLNSPVLITPRAFCVAYIDTALRMGEVNKDVHAIVKDAGNALSHCLTLNAMGCVCTGIKGKDEIAFPMDHFDLSGNNIKDESIRIVVQRMSWGVLKKGDLRVAEFRKAVAASANKEITRAFNQGKNYQQAVKDTFNKVLKETRQEAAEAIKNRADFISNSDIRSGFIDKDGSIKSFAVLKDHDTAARFGLAKENVR